MYGYIHHGRPDSNPLSTNLNLASFIQKYALANDDRQCVQENLR